MTDAGQKWSSTVSVYGESVRQCRFFSFYRTACVHFDGQQNDLRSRFIVLLSDTPIILQLHVGSRYLWLVFEGCGVGWGG